MADITNLFAVNPALEEKFRQLPPEDQAIIMQNLGPKPVEGPNGPVYLQPGMPVDMRKEALTQAGVLQNFQPTTPGAELSAANNPISQGLGAAGQKLTEPGIAMGLLQKLAAPGAGLGQAAGTTAHNILSNIPGLGGPEGIIPAAGAAAAHAGGTLLGDTATGNLVAKGLTRGPGAAVDVINSVRQKGAMGALKELMPSFGKEAKMNQLTKTLGQPATFGERVANPVSKDVKALYEAASQQGPVSAKDVADAAFQAFAKESSMASPNTKATKVLGDLYNKFANQTKAGYQDVLDEAQRLRLTAQGLEERFPQVAKTLHDARNIMLDVLDNTSALARQAGQLYRKDILAKDILQTLRGPNPGPKIRNLLEQEPNVAATFGLNTPAAIEAFANAADKIGTTHTAAQMIAKWGTLAGGGALLGYIVHRKLFDIFIKD